MKIRVIDFGYVSDLQSQAIFHGIAHAMKKGDDPVLCLCNPQTPYVCVGMHQEVAKEVDEAFCEANKLPVYRRHIGGGTVYLDNNQLFFHFIYPAASVPRKAEQLYPMFIEPVVKTYRHFGINAQYRPVNDIQVNGRKIGGTGAATLEDAVILAGSFMFDFDTETMSKALKVPSEKFRDKLFQTLNEYITTFSRELDTVPTREAVIAQFIKEVANSLDIETVSGEANERELDCVQKMEQQLLDPEWTYQVGRRFVDMGVKISADRHLTESAHKAPGGMIKIHLLEQGMEIEDVLITGDFTCLPESGVSTLAEKLSGCTLEQNTLTTEITKIIADESLDLPGVSPEDIATAISLAIHDGQR